VFQFSVCTNGKDVTLDIQCAYLGTWRTTACNSVWSDCRL